MRTRRRLTNVGKTQLLDLGLTHDQVYWIDHHFQSIVEDLRQPARNADVRSELEKVANHSSSSWCASHTKLLSGPLSR